MFKQLLLALLVALALSRNYPLYKQCDPSWANDQLGTSSNTICKAGCCMSSVAMGLAGTGRGYNPHTLNIWLKSNGGYVSGDLFVWTSVNKLGMNFEGKVSNSQIKAKLDQGKVVICNVHNGGHWVLAHGYSGDNILVNDPGYSVTSYALNTIVDGQNAIYGGNGYGYQKLASLFKAIMGETEEEQKWWTMADGGLLENVEQN
jgi:hypothetical protein